MKRVQLAFVIVLAALASSFGVLALHAQTAPTLLDDNLRVEAAVEGLALPTTMAFIGPDDFLVLEKNTGRVVRVTHGVATGAVLDLSVNFASERGLLGIALHPDFPEDPGVYLFWSCNSTAARPDDFHPGQTECSDPPELGLGDSDDMLGVPLLGNRVDRFEWNGSALVFDHNLIKLRSFQNDGGPDPPNQGDQGQPARGNHNAGILRFGPDGKLYVLFGDQGRRGQLQNLPSGPTASGIPDDQFGGPEPDDAHLAGVILRLNDDGSTPGDNPLFEAGADVGGEVGENLQRVFAYGLRNSFGMAFHPRSGDLWLQENGEDAFDEINLVEPGFNSGWIQVTGPLERIDEYRQIETTSLHAEEFPNLQQLRWGPEEIATSLQSARGRFFEIPGSHYSDPEFSWKHVVAPAALGFVAGSGLGPSYRGDMIVGLSVPFPEDGPLLRFPMVGNGRKLQLKDHRLRDQVADNETFNDLTESESLLWGRGFGVVTDIQTGPDGNLYVVSLSQGAVYEISRAPRLAHGRGNGRGPFGLDATGVSLAATTPRAGTAVVRFGLVTGGAVQLTMHDISGRRVATLVQDQRDAGEHEVPWSVDRLSNGVYFARLLVQSAQGAPTVRTAKVALVK